MLICPKCKSKLNKIDNTYKCSNNHSYDISKYRYVNLLLSKTNAGDDKIMVDARYNFLAKDYYLPLAKSIINILSNYIQKDSLILDGGCGTGYYDSIIKIFYPNIIGYDISKDAITKAARLNKDLLYFVASSNDIPLSNNSIDCILNIFTPTFENEVTRLLKDNGIIIIVAPKDNHLIELKKVIYENAYLNEEEIPSFNNLCLDKSYQSIFDSNLNNEDLENLIKMTPYFYKTSKDNLKKIKNIDSLDVTFAFNIYIYKKRTNY